MFLVFGVLFIVVALQTFSLRMIHEGIFLSMIAALFFSAQRKNLEHTFTFAGDFGLKPKAISWACALVGLIALMGQFYFYWGGMKSLATVALAIALIFWYYAVKLSNPPSVTKDSIGHQSQLAVSWKLIDSLMLSALIVVGLYLRVKDLIWMRPGIAEDESLQLRRAYEMLSKGFDPFSVTDWWFGEIMHLPTSILLWFGVPIVWALKLPGIVYGAGSIGLLYALALKLFNRHAAFFSAFFLAISVWHNIFSRWGGYLMSYGIFWMLCSLLFLVLFFRTGRAGYLVCTAYSLVVALWTPYFTSALVPTFFVIFIWYFFLSQRIMKRSLGLCHCAIFLISFLGAYSLRAYILLYAPPGNFLPSGSFIGDVMHVAQPSTARFTDQFWQSFLALVYRGGIAEVRLIPADDAPYLDAMTGGLFLLGFGFCILRFQYFPCRLVFLAFLFSWMFPSIVTLSSQRMAGMLPLACLMAGIAASIIWSAPRIYEWSFYSLVAVKLAVLSALGISSKFNYVAFFEHFGPHKMEWYRYGMGQPEKVLVDFLTREFSGRKCFYTPILMSPISIGNSFVYFPLQPIENLLNQKEVSEPSLVILELPATQVAYNHAPKYFQEITSKLTINREKFHKLFPNAKKIEGPKGLTGEDLWEIYEISLQ